MSFNIIKQLNADAQEGSVPTENGDEAAAITNVPVENVMEETNETALTPEVTVEATPEVVAETAPVVDIEIKAPVEETIATAHDDFDWSVDKRNVTSYKIGRTHV